MEVVTTLKGEYGETVIKGVATAENAIGDSIQKKNTRKDFDGNKSQKSFARSIRSRKMGDMFDSLEQRLCRAEEYVETLKSQTDKWMHVHEPGWNLVSRNVFDLTDMINSFVSERGFVGQKTFNDNPMGSREKVFENYLDHTEELEKKVTHMAEDQ